MKGPQTKWWRNFSFLSRQCLVKHQTLCNIAQQIIRNAMNNLDQQKPIFYEGAKVSSIYFATLKAGSLLIDTALTKGLLVNFLDLTND